MAFLSSPLALFGINSLVRIAAVAVFSPIRNYAGYRLKPHFVNGATGNFGWFEARPIAHAHTLYW